MIIERVLIVPDAAVWSCHLVAHEPDTIGAWSRFNLVYRRISPSHNGRLLSMGRANRRKAESGRATANTVLLVGSVIIHVALARVSLAPGVFVRNDVFRFSKIYRPRVQRRVQVVNVNQNSVRCNIVTVAGVIVRC